MMMLKLATFFTLVIGATAAVNTHSSEGGRGGLRGLKSTDEDSIKNGIEAVESLEESTNLYVMNDNVGMDKFDDNRNVVEVFAPSSDLHEDTDEINEERSLSSDCYDFYSGAMRTSNHHNAKGVQGTDYHLYEHTSESSCKSLCSSHSWCKAYEYYHSGSRCELWKKWYGFYKYEHGFKTYVKKHC
jgi:hypothetical protein